LLRLTSNYSPPANAGAGHLDQLSTRSSGQCCANVIGQLCAAIRYQAPENAPQMPLLILASVADRLIDPPCSQSLEQQWHLILDAGLWVAGQARDWLTLQTLVAAHTSDQRKSPLILASHGN